jgi:hypothetical protein
MSVVNQLPGLTAGIGESGPVHDIVQTPFQHYQKIFTGYTLAAVRDIKVALELAFQKSVHSADFLLFPQLQGKVSGFFARPSLFPGGIGTAIIRTFVRETPITLQKELGPFPAAYSALGISIFSQFSSSLNSAALGRATAVMRNRGNVPNKSNINANIVDGPHCGFTPGTGSLDQDSDCVHAVFLGLLGRGLSRFLRRKGSTLP